MNKKRCGQSLMYSGLLCIAACNPAEQPIGGEASLIPATINDAIVVSPQLGNWGVDTNIRDLAIEPGDDFFRYATGTWLKTFEIPAARARYGTFEILGEISEAQIHNILDELANSEPAAGTLERKVSDYFLSYMDVAAVDQLGVQPLRAHLADIEAITTIADLTAAFGAAPYIGAGSPLEIAVVPDRLNPDRYQLNLGVAGISMPDRDYYLEDSPQMAELRIEFVAHVTRMLALAGFTDSAEMAQTVLNIETRIAEIMWPRDQRRNRDLTFNPMTYADFKVAYPGFAWDAYFAAAGITDPADINVIYPSATQPVIELVNTVALEDWQHYLTYQLLAKHAGVLSAQMEQESFHFYGTVLNGQQQMRERWERGVLLIGNVEGLGEALGQIYVQKHFPASSKQQMEELVENLRAALAQSIAENDWMDAATKSEANLKLNTFHSKIGYPDEWRDLSAITIDRNSLFANAQNVRAFIHQDLIARLSRPTDRERWRMSPQTVNAGYTAAFNEILFPAAILQPPFFDPAADLAVNYGAIGAVIGHEMGHGFDDQGSKSDYLGIQRNWWTDVVREAFVAKTTALARQYDAFGPVPGVAVDGDFTLGENIGDVGGISMAYRAYRLALGDKEVPVIDGFTGDQRFFLAWAQVWQQKIREEALLSQLKSDPHSPAEFRVNGVVRNIDAWYDAFDVQPGDALYLPPEERVRIW